LVNAQISRAWLLLTFGFALITVEFERSIVRFLFRRARARGQLQRRVVIIGANAEALEVVRMLRTNSSLGYDVVGIVECGADNGVVSPVPVLGDWSDTLSIVKSADVSGVIIATSSVDIGGANRLARELMELGYHVELTSGLLDISADRLIARPLGRRPVMYVEPVRLSGWRAAAKRGFDIVSSAAMLFVLMPILAVAAILIKVDSRGPVFFMQARVGKDGKLFRVRKLRTMVSDAEQMLDVLKDKNEADGALFKMEHDPRVTRVGAILRKWSIDELPQLFNVLIGEMSLVGPRPAIPSEMSSWSEGLQNRLRVKPGITGMWQVNGRSSSSFDDYVRHDLYYVDNWSLLTDVAIVLKTIPVVLLGKGAY
jgi:exopolysaccharide biosynthesis polyprenyl glycosylphosphotransferase